MKIVAKGVLEGGFWGHGRKWPRDTSIELEVTAEEYAVIAADRNIVCVVVPELQATPIQVKSNNQQQQRGR